jgi:NAD(P)H-dependent nitrite reductase small subunit
MADTFHTVAALEELEEGTGKCVTVDEQQVAIFKVGDEVLAIHNVCPHQGASLAYGFVKGDTVTCPLHGWDFDLRTGVNKQGLGAVRSYDVRVEDGQVQLLIEE